MHINEIINDILNRYKSLGYKTFPIKSKVIETYNYSELVPFASEKDGTVIYIDTSVKEDLTKPSAYFYLAHEIAHCLTNANHGDKKFEEAIQKYNSKFSPKTASDPDDSYNKKYLPTFYKKDSWLDNAKSDEQFQKDLITKPWKKEKYFNY